MSISAVSYTYTTNAYARVNPYPAGPQHAVPGAAKFIGNMALLIIALVLIGLLCVVAG